MAEKWSEFVNQMEDKESWLAAVVEKEADAAEAHLSGEADSGEASGCDAETLYRTAAFVRGAVTAPEVPEHKQSEARAAGLAVLADRPSLSPDPSVSSSAWLGRFGSWLQVAFNLFRRR